MRRPADADHRVSAPEASGWALADSHRRMVLLAGVFAATIFLYWDSLTGMASQWSMASYRHAPFVPFISLFLLWREREILDQPFTGSLWGLLALTLSVALWVVSKAVFIQATEHIALLGIINGLVWTTVGDSAYRRLVIPFGFLVFAVPIGGEIVPWLMVTTADISAAALDLFNIPVYREGQFFKLAGGTFHVADVCSGIRYLNAGLMIGSLVALLDFNSWLRRISYVAAVGAVFVFTNGLRAFIVMAVASGTDLKYLAGYDHVIFGWFLFFIVLVAMILLADRYSDA